MEMEIIDCFGDICPVPIIKIEKRLKATEKGESFMVVSDHSCTLESIKDVFSKRALDIQIEEVMNGVWEIIFTKL
jgi:TusA-related sulfurtransferase